VNDKIGRMYTEELRLLPYMRYYARFFWREWGKLQKS